MRITETKDSRLIATLNEHVQTIHVALYPEYFKVGQLEEIEQFFASIMSKENSNFAVVEDNDEAVGYVWFDVRNYPENPFKRAYTSVYVHQISVNSNLRKHGLGRALMEYVYNFANEHGINIIELDHWSNNEMASSFYTKEGFKHYRECLFKVLN